MMDGGTPCATIGWGLDACCPHDLRASLIRGRRGMSVGLESQLMLRYPGFHGQGNQAPRFQSIYLLRCPVAERLMDTLPVVEHLDELKDG